MSNIEMTEVDSTSVAAIGYDKDTKEMRVQWKKAGSGGSTSSYSNVPPEVVDQIQSAPSIGSAVHRLLKGQYPHSYAID